MNIIINNKRSGSGACQENKSGRNYEGSGWWRVIGELAGELIRAKREGDEAARERFYVGFQRLTRQTAVSELRAWGWRGDVYQDAEDVASQCVVNLLQQEAQGGGIFDLLEQGAEFRGYLSVMIRKSCWQRATRWKPSCADVSLDRPLAGGDPDRDGPGRTRLDELADRPLEDAEVRQHLRGLMEGLREDRHGRYRRLPVGMTPLDCVLDEEAAMAVMKGISKRTLQRYAKDIRDRLAKDAGLTLNARGYAKSRRGPSRSGPPEMEMS